MLRQVKIFSTLKNVLMTLTKIFKEKPNSPYRYNHSIDTIFYGIRFGAIGTRLYEIDQWTKYHDGP